ncbi:MAG: multicopper oxidase family protein, partial [Gemmatimonadaceae bacterium]
MSGSSEGLSNRREFLRRATAAGAALAAGSLINSCAPDSPIGVSPGLPGDALRNGILAARNPLRIPPTVSPSALTLSAAQGTADLGGGQLTSAHLYNALLPGPTIRVNTGDAAAIAFQNGLTESSTVHWHGMIVPSASDGHPLQAVGPGSSYAYSFPIVQRAATNWYHPHPHMNTARQINLGLAGFFIVNDAQEAALNLPSGAYELPLVLRDALVDANGQLTTGPGTMVLLANGVRDATVNVDTARYRLRILNASAWRVFNLSLSNGRPLHLIGNDGGLIRSRT